MATQLWNGNENLSGSASGADAVTYKDGTVEGALDEINDSLSKEVTLWESNATTLGVTSVPVENTSQYKSFKVYYSFLNNGEKAWAQKYIKEVINNQGSFTIWERCIADIQCRESGRPFKITESSIEIGQCWFGDPNDATGALTLNKDYGIVPYKITGIK